MSHSKGQNPDLAQTPALLSATSALSNFFPIYTVNSNQMHQCFIFPKITSANTPAWSILTWPTFANKGHDNHVNSTQRSRTHCKMSFFFFKPSNPGVGKLFHKESESKYIQFCVPDGLYCKDLILSLGLKRSH